MGIQDIHFTAMWFNVTSIALAGYGFNASFFLFAIPITLLRLVFPAMMYRYYRNMTSRGSVILTGVLAELPMLLFGIPLLIPLIVGLPILGLLPVPKGPTSWPEQKESGASD